MNLKLSIKIIIITKLKRAENIRLININQTVNALANNISKRYKLSQANLKMPFLILSKSLSNIFRSLKYS